MMVLVTGQTLPERLTSLAEGRQSRSFKNIMIVGMALLNVKKELPWAEGKTCVRVVGGSEGWREEGNGGVCSRSASRYHPVSQRH